MTAPMQFCAVVPRGSQDEVIAVSCLNACTAADAEPGSLRRHADHRVRAQEVLPQSSGSCFQTRWYLHLPLRCRLEMVPEPFSCLARRFLHARDRRRTGSTEAVPVPSTGTATEVRPVTSSPSSRGQSSGGGALWTPAYTPG
jgi:hypothetical protein